jgi:5'-nucleotidase, C-terminal domain
LADYGHLDVVFLPDGACRGDILAGNFTRQDAARVVAPNIGLVVFPVNGTELVQILEEAVFMGLSSAKTQTVVSYRIPDPHGATNKQNTTTTTAATMNLFPVAVAGIQANLAPMSPRGSRVVTASVLSPICEWQRVDMLDSRHYNILTTHELVRALPSMERNTIITSNKKDNMELLFRGHERRESALLSGINSHWELQDAMWMHAKSACTIQDPYMQGKTCHVKKRQQPRMCRNSPIAPPFTFNHPSQPVILGTCPSQPTIIGGRGVHREATDENKKQPTKSVNYTQTANIPTVVVLQRDNQVVKK